MVNTYFWSYIFVNAYNIRLDVNTLNQSKYYVTHICHKRVLLNNITQRTILVQIDILDQNSQTEFLSTLWAQYILDKKSRFVFCLHNGKILTLNFPEHLGNAPVIFRCSNKAGIRFFKFDSVRLGVLFFQQEVLP